MLDEEMDNMIRQAADQHHPSYDNKAWDQMEQLLDKHLPQKKGRRGFFFWILLCLLIGGGLLVGGYYFYGNKNEKFANTDLQKENGQTTATTVIPDDNSTGVQNGSIAVYTMIFLEVYNEFEKAAFRVVIMH